jgi:response regulator of citrate/malate metabolism
VERTYFIIDDDNLQNEIHSILLKKIDPELKIVSFISCKAALLELKQNQSPEIIFLDLHIPGEGITNFLDEIQKTDFAGDIYLMSSAAYLEDPGLISKYPSIKDFIAKPLLDYKLRSILGIYA